MGKHGIAGHFRWQERKQRHLSYKALAAEKEQRDERRRGRRHGPGGAPIARQVVEGVVAGTSGGALVRLDGEARLCRLGEGALPPDVGQVAVGDRVLVERVGERATIVEVLPRRSRLVRLREDRSRRAPAVRREQVLAANVDTAVIVAAAADPAFHPRLVDRYLIMCEYGGVNPLICINKCDLVAQRPDLSAYTSLGVPVVFASATTGAGIEALRERIAGGSAVLTGQSGVGKSSLVNRLLGTDAQRTGEVRAYDGKGRHTTSASSLHPIDERTYLIDTPGIRSLGLWNVEPDELQSYFPELEAYAADCRFRDCRHLGEPDCAVRAAAERGDLAPYRYDSYLRLLEER